MAVRGNLSNMHYIHSINITLQRIIKDTLKFWRSTAIQWCHILESVLTKMATLKSRRHWKIIWWILIWVNLGKLTERSTEWKNHRKRCSGHVKTTNYLNELILSFVFNRPRIPIICGSTRHLAKLSVQDLNGKFSISYKHFLVRNLFSNKVYFLT